MNGALYSLITATYDAAPKNGARCTDAEWQAFQDVVHGFWGKAREVLGDTNPDDPDFRMATAVEAQVREYLRIIREES